MIDEKGRLFGKINIIDLLVILLVLVIAVVLGIKFFGSGGGLGGKNPSTTLTYTVKVQGVAPEVFESIQAWVPGDKLMAAGEVLDGQVTKVVAVPHVVNATLSAQDGALIIPVDRETLDLTFTIEANVVNVTTNEVGTQEVRIGKPHIVKTCHFELGSGIITQCGWADGAAA